MEKNLHDTPPGLLPCPFCGTAPVEDRIEPHKHYIVQMPDYPGSWSIECVKCEFRIFDHDARENAVRKWNTRQTRSESGATEIPTPEDLIERMALTMRHDYGLMQPDEADGVRRDAEQLWTNDIRPWLARQPRSASGAIEGWENINICTVEGCGLPALDQPKSAGRSVCWRHDPGR